MQVYTDDYYSLIAPGSLRSARVIVPVVMGFFEPRSVVDVGCAVGSWLAVFREHGVDEILGLDGAHVNPKLLSIPTEKFRAADLTQPLRLDREFDLVVSVEVAEHLASQYAETFIDSLTSLGPLILFSAAIPFQGRADHVNEQWPDYWVERFEKRGYLGFDLFRRRLWAHREVEWWYAQNLLLFARSEAISRFPVLATATPSSAEKPLALVHPLCLLNAADVRRWSLRRVLSILPGMVGRAVLRRLHRS